jgi:hypothetical protein
MKKQLFLYILFPWILAACASPQEIAQKHNEELYNTCLNYGFQPNTSQFSNCMMQTDQQQNYERSRIATAFMDRPEPRPYQLPTPPAYTPPALTPPNLPTPTQCQTYGNNINCIKY